MKAGAHWLELGALLSAAAALLHIAIIIGGPEYYRLFGAGERMARMAEHGSPRPALIAGAIAAVLAAWSAYALSGAGRIGRLPLLRTGLVGISTIYLVRGLAVVPAVALGRANAFVVWSSLIVLVYGAVHAIGTFRAWPALGPARP